MSRQSTPSDVQRETAALWLARRTGSSLSPEELQEFELWLNEDHLNRLAWDEMRVLWAHLEQPSKRVARASPPRHALTHKFTSLRGWLPGIAGLATAALTIVLVNPNFINNLQADIVTGQDIVTPITLSDGSRVQLGADSALAFDFDKTKRYVHLIRGEAFFEVTPGSSPDFKIKIDDNIVQVIGTRFNINQIADKTVISVSEGIVSVKGAQDNMPEQITQGQQLTVTNGTSAPIEMIDPESSIAWMSGRLVVDQAMVADVVATLSRHNSKQLYVRGKLAQRRISGTFSLQDIDGSLETIAETLNAKIIRTIPFVTFIF